MDTIEDSGETDVRELRRSHLTPAEMDRIAEKAAVKALEKVYADIGQSLARKLAWLFVAAVVGLALWLAGKQSLPIPHP